MGLMMTSRIITSLAHGSFLWDWFYILQQVWLILKNVQVQWHLMFMGLSLSNILGVPFGTLVGQNFGWQMTFIM
jgi:DHA1 family inner membrane transport protein